MKKTERLNGIVYALKERGKLTAKELSDIFEVSMRTIYRDIDALSQLKVPLIAYEGASGGYTIDEDYFLPSVRLSEREILMLLMVLKAGEAIKLPNLNSDYRLLRSKLINELCREDQQTALEVLKRVHFEMNRILPKAYVEGIFDGILESFQSHKNMVLVYFNPERGTHDKRLVSPKDLFYDEGGWYLTGYCHLRKEKRVFRLDRILELKVDASENLFLNTPISSHSEKFILKHYVIEIEEGFYRIVKDDELFQSAEIIEKADWLKLRLTTAHEDVLLKLALSEPHRIRVHEPSAFVDKLKKTVHSLINIYN